MVKVMDILKPLFTGSQPTCGNAFFSHKYTHSPYLVGSCMGQGFEISVFLKRRLCYKPACVSSFFTQNTQPVPGWDLFVVRGRPPDRRMVFDRELVFDTKKCNFDAC